MFKSAALALAHYLCNEIVANLPSRKLRTLFYRIWLGKLGRRAAVHLHCRFRDGRNVSIGDNVVVNYGTMLDGRFYPVEIGSNVSVGPNAQIYTLSHDPQSERFATAGGPVVLEDYCWVAANALILPGVRVGYGAVVAAGSVVTKDVPAHTIVAGVPAKPVGKRTEALTYELDYAPWLQ